jgi:hypothetical protein
MIRRLSSYEGDMNPRMLRCGMMLLLAATATHAPVELAAEAGMTRPGREILLPRSEVLDTFLGYVVGLIRSNASALLDIPYLLDLLPEVRDSPDMRRMRSLAWLGPGVVEEPRLAFWFDGDLHYPIPISILGYHPGSIDASAEIELREMLRGRGSKSFRGPYHLFTVDRGFVRVTFDEWLDGLAGSILDTFTLEAFALLTYRGEWHAVLVGRGVHGKTVPWVVNLARNKIAFPVPRELRAVADALPLAEAPGVDSVASLLEILNAAP